MRANGVGSWLERWGLWILLVLAVIIGMLCWLFPVSRKGKPQILKEAQDGAAALKKKAAEALVEHEYQMAVRRNELKAIETIVDEDERLKALANFANRRY